MYERRGPLTQYYSFEGGGGLGGGVGRPLTDSEREEWMRQVKEDEELLEKEKLRAERLKSLKGNTTGLHSNGGGGYDDGESPTYDSSAELRRNENYLTGEHTTHWNYDSDW